MPSPTINFLQHRLVVGVAELAVSNNPVVTLCTYSLGSCLGVSVYDPQLKVGGLVHVMLPDSSISPAKAQQHPAMFVDTGLPALLRAACQLRADRRRLHICVAGGGQIMDESGYFNIGRRNYESLTAWLTREDLRLMAEQVGGMVNRTMYLSLATGEVRLKVSGQPTEVVLCRG